MTIPSWLSRSLRSFLYSSSVYCHHLLLISSASVRSLTFLSFLSPALHEMFPSCSNFLKEIFSLSHSIFLLFNFFAFFHLRRPSYLFLFFSGTLYLVLLQYNNNNVQHILKCSVIERYLMYTSRSQWKTKMCSFSQFQKEYINMHREIVE